MAWYETCEWNDQDASRTLEHVDSLLTLWSAEIEEWTDGAADARQRIEEIGGGWRESRDRAALATELWSQLTVIDNSRATRAPTQHGSVSQINSSGGGVPKSAVDAAIVGWRGIEGDVQKTRVHHGRPWQALCLWSADVIDRLAAAGHPVVAGGVGENLTLRDVDWSTLRAGTVIDVGEVRCQLTAPAVPCSKIGANFTDRDISLVDHDVHPDANRWYAAVVRPGAIAAGDAVTVSPRT